MDPLLIATHAYGYRPLGVAVVLNDLAVVQSLDAGARKQRGEPETTR